MADSVDVEWYLDSASAATGWKVVAVALRSLVPFVLDSIGISACGAMIAVVSVYLLVFVVVISILVSVLKE